MIKDAYVFDGLAHVSGEWRSAMCSHEFSVGVRPNGSWDYADVIQYGEWDVFTDEDEARDCLGEDVAAEVDRAAAKLFGGAGA